MSYALKATGIPASYTIKSCLVVDSDGTTIVDLAGNTISRHANVTVSTGSWNSNARNYFSTTGSGFNPETITWPTPVALATGGSGFTVFIAAHSLGPASGNPTQLIGASGSSDGVLSSPGAGGYKAGHTFASTEFYVPASQYQSSPGPKLSILSRGLQGGAQSTYGADHGSALASQGSGSDPGFIPGTWNINIIGGQPSNNWGYVSAYLVLVIQGQMSVADADLLHTDWFAELIDTGVVTPSQLAYPVADIATGSWRATTGLETVRNQWTYTESLDHAPWSVLQATITADTVANPVNGAVDADALVEDATVGGTHFVSRNDYAFTATNPYTISRYVKPAGRDWAVLEVGGSVNRWFNVTLGTVGSGNNSTGSIVSVGGGWYRIIMAFNAVFSASSTCYLTSAASDGSDVCNGISAAALYSWGAQLDVGALTDYQSILTTDPPRATSSTLYPVVADSSSGTPDDTTYIFTASNSDTCKLSFTALPDPLSSSSHKLRFRTYNVTGSLSLSVYLYCGATLVASTSATLSTSAATTTYTLAAGEANAITDYTNLRAWFTSPVSTTSEIRVTWAQLETPLGTFAVTSFVDALMFASAF